MGTDIAIILHVTRKYAIVFKFEALCQPSLDVFHKFIFRVKTVTVIELLFAPKDLLERTCFKQNGFLQEWNLSKRLHLSIPMYFKS